MRRESQDVFAALLRIVAPFAAFAAVILLARQALLRWEAHRRSERFNLKARAWHRRGRCLDDPPPRLGRDRAEDVDFEEVKR